RQARRVPRGGVPASALPTRRADDVDAVGGGPAGAGKVKRARPSDCVTSASDKFTMHSCPSIRRWRAQCDIVVARKPLRALEADSRFIISPRSARRLPMAAVDY